MLDRPAEKRVPTVWRVAASPSAVVFAGAGVAAGELAHLGVAVALLLGAAAYGSRLGWAALRRRGCARGLTRLAGSGEDAGEGRRALGKPLGP